MPYRAISTDLKQQALWLLSNGYLPEEICTILNVSPRSVQSWANNLTTHGHVLPSLNPTRGQQHTLNAIHMYGLIGIIEASPAMYLDKLQDWLALEYDILISKTTLHDNIRDAGISYKLLCWRAVERDEVVRERWKEDVGANFVAAQMVWTDELSKDDQMIYHHYGRAATGQCAVIDVQWVCGEQYSILPAMSVDGYVTTHIVSGSVQGDKFFDFIVEDVVCHNTHLLFSMAANHGPLSFHS